MSSSIIQSIQHLKIADEFLHDFIRSNPGTKGAALFTNYSAKVNWIFRDLITNPSLPDIVRNGIKNEINSDVLALPDMNSKLAILSPEKREIVDLLTDALLRNEKIEFTDGTMQVSSMQETR